MTLANQETLDRYRGYVQLLSGVVTLLALPLLVGLGWRALDQIQDNTRANDRQQVVIDGLERRLSNEIGYNADDATRDLGVISKILDDHEGRLRYLERGSQP